MPILTPVISVRPVVLPASGRGADLRVRVTAPSSGRDRPIVVFSHGFGESMDGYAPLAEFWAANGFTVLQPTHLDSQTLGVAPEDPRTPMIWRFRIEDLRRVLDELDLIEASVPGLAGRLNRDRIAVAGHSWGATTASALLGARIVDRDGNVGEDMSDRRVTAGVLLAVAGTGGDDLTAFAAEHFSFMNPSFVQMTTPALLVAGDQDQSPLSTRGPDWWTDAYTLSPGDKSLLTLFGAEHTMGGIAGYSTHETTDWSRERVTLIQQVTGAYLRSALNPEDEAWSQLQAALTKDSLRWVGSSQNEPAILQPWAQHRDRDRPATGQFGPRRPDATAAPRAAGDQQPLKPSTPALSTSSSDCPLPTQTTSRAGSRTSSSPPRFPVPVLHGKPDAPCVHAWGRLRLDVENSVAAPTRVHTIPKGALIMVISTRFSISTDGYEESND